MTEYLVGPNIALPEGDLAIIDAGGIEVGVFRFDGCLYAIENRCLHQGGPVCYGELTGRVEVEVAPDRTVGQMRVSKTRVHLVCPWHAWEYDLKTGASAADPRLKLRRFKTSVRDGNIYVQA